MMKKRIKITPAVHKMKARLRGSLLHTVCEEARCPNMCECFGRGTAAFMILGDICTRSCGFCGVKKGRPLPLDPDEPVRVAKMAEDLNLRHAVITSVTRDDLPDEGANHFAETIKRIRGKAVIEVLTPDFHAREEFLRAVCNAGPDIFNHNIETVRRITRMVRPQADFDRSLEVLRLVKKNYPQMTVKSGIMAGLGERKEEVVETLKELCDAGVEVVTIGQYFAPSRTNLPVAEQVTDETFERYRKLGEAMGIKKIFSGRFVRSSYMAEDIIKGQRTALQPSGGSHG